MQDLAVIGEAKLACGPSHPAPGEMPRLIEAHDRSPKVMAWTAEYRQGASGLDLSWDRIRELAEGFESYSIIVDITDTKPPNAELRSHLRALYQSISPQRVAVFTGKNLIINVTAKFVLRSVLGKHQCSVHRTMDEALRALEAVPDGR